MKQLAKQLVRKAIRRRGWDLIKGPNPQDFLTSRNVGLVLDMGASIGTYGESIRRWGYAGPILSFEPTRVGFERLKVVTANDPTWDIRKVAAGSKPGRASINVSRNSGYSSFKSLSALGHAYDPAAEIVETEDVEIIPLDSLHHTIKTAGPVFLKIDTQGFERDILDGATLLLESCIVGVQLELPVEHLYEGTWSFTEALAYMAERGFVPAQITTANALRQDPASAVEFDCVFRRAA